MRRVKLFTQGSTLRWIIICASVCIKFNETFKKICYLVHPLQWNYRCWKSSFLNRKWQNTGKTTAAQAYLCRMTLKGFEAAKFREVSNSMLEIESLRNQIKMKEWNSHWKLMIQQRKEIKHTRHFYLSWDQQPRRFCILSCSDHKWLWKHVVEADDVNKYGIGRNKSMIFDYV